MEKENKARVLRHNFYAPKAMFIKISNSSNTMI